MSMENVILQGYVVLDKLFYKDTLCVVRDPLLQVSKMGQSPHFELLATTPLLTGGTWDTMHLHTL